MQLKLRVENSSVFDQSGLMILEAEPQVRSIITSGSSNKFSYRLPFPYILFIIQYTKDNYRGQTKYFYPGLYGNGLRVYGSNSPLKTLENKVFLLPNEESGLGLVCTNHDYDGKTYNSVIELANEVIGLWWGHNHSLIRRDISFEQWSSMSLEDVLSGKMKFLKFNELGYFKTTDMIENNDSDDNIRTVMRSYNKFNINTCVEQAAIMDEKWPCEKFS